MSLHVNLFLTVSQNCLESLDYLCRLVGVVWCGVVWCHNKLFHRVTFPTQENDSKLFSCNFIGPHHSRKSRLVVFRNLFTSPIRLLCKSDLEDMDGKESKRRHSYARKKGCFKQNHPNKKKQGSVGIISYESLRISSFPPKISEMNRSRDTRWFRRLTKWIC